MREVRHCENCRATLRAEASFCSSCGASGPAVDDMKCPTCGNDNPEDAQFCGGCGASLSASMVRFKEAIKLGFRNYVNCSGRTTRAAFWWWYLFGVIGFCGLSLIKILASVLGARAGSTIVYVAGILTFLSLHSSDACTIQVSGHGGGSC